MSSTTSSKTSQPDCHAEWEATEERYRNEMDGCSVHYTSSLLERIDLSEEARTEALDFLARTLVRRLSRRLLEGYLRGLRKDDV